jgi:hypothetical protein
MVFGIGPGHGRRVHRTPVLHRSSRPGSASPGSPVLLGSPPHRGLECPYLRSHQKRSRKERITIPSIVPSRSSPGGFPRRLQIASPIPARSVPAHSAGPASRPTALPWVPPRRGLISGIQSVTSSALVIDLSENCSEPGTRDVVPPARPGQNAGGGERHMARCEPEIPPPHRTRQPAGR